MYCVDPSDGVAKFYFTRPQWPGRDAPSQERLPYTHLCLPVDPKARPMLERLQVTIAINEDLIAEISARSLMRQEARCAEIHDLEFGLSLSQATQSI
jgi:molecular chaperone DnaK